MFIFLPNPHLVLLDEPTAALDPDVAQEVRAFIREQRKQRKISMLFTSHNMHEVSELCDRVLIIKQGKLIAENSPEQLAALVSYARIHLTITSDIVYLSSLLDTADVIYCIDLNLVTIEIEENRISTLLNSLAHHNVTYSQITIDKPTLEDYFLSIVKKEKNIKKELPCT